jgi:hypothetical protein
LGKSAKTDKPSIAHLVERGEGFTMWWRDDGLLVQCDDGTRIFYPASFWSRMRAKLRRWLIGTKRGA